MPDIDMKEEYNLSKGTRGRFYGQDAELVPPLHLERDNMPNHPRIALDPAVLVGKPVVAGTRLSVEFIIGLLADGWAEADILRNYPGLSREDIAACLAYARDLLASERVYPSAA